MSNMVYFFLKYTYKIVPSTSANAATTSIPGDTHGIINEGIPETIYYVSTTDRIDCSYYCRCRLPGNAIQP